MSDEDYVRVRGSKPPAAWFAEGGTHKVVPADAIVIERGDLPEVFADKSVVAGPVAGAPYDNPDLLTRKALGYLALAEYLRANPPVDEAQVEALTQIVSEIGGPSLGGGSTPHADTFARRLVARGVRVEVEK